MLLVLNCSQKVFFHEYTEMNVLKSRLILDMITVKKAQN